MNLDPSSMTITGVIATGLSVVFALAAHMNSKRKQQMRQTARAAMSAEEANAIRESAPVASSAAHVAVVQASTTAAPVPSVRPSAPPVVPVVPVVQPAAAHVVAPATPPPPPKQATVPRPALFKQYITRPGMKTQTPTSESGQSERDYVWE